MRASSRPRTGGPGRQESGAFSAMSGVGVGAAGDNGGSQQKPRRGRAAPPPAAATLLNRSPGRGAGRRALALDGPRDPDLAGNRACSSRPWIGRRAPSVCCAGGRAWARFEGGCANLAADMPGVAICSGGCLFGMGGDGAAEFGRMPATVQALMISFFSPQGCTWLAFGGNSRSMNTKLNRS